MVISIEAGKIFPPSILPKDVSIRPFYIKYAAMAAEAERFSPKRRQLKYSRNPTTIEASYWRCMKVMAHELDITRQYRIGCAEKYAFENGVIKASGWVVGTTAEMEYIFLSLG